MGEFIYDINRFRMKMDVKEVWPNLDRIIKVVEFLTKNFVFLGINIPIPTNCQEK